MYVSYGHVEEGDYLTPNNLRSHFEALSAKIIDLFPGNHECETDFNAILVIPLSIESFECVEGITLKRQKWQIKNMIDIMYLTVDGELLTREEAINHGSINPAMFVDEKD